MTLKNYLKKKLNNSGQNNFHLTTLMKKNENLNNDENMELNNIIDEEHINLIEKIHNVKYQYKYLSRNLKRISEKKNRKIFFEKNRRINK